MGALVSSLRWLAYGSVRSPGLFWLDWLKVNLVLARRQLGTAWDSLGKVGPLSWLFFQLETHRVLWEIEVNHLMETSLEKRLGRYDGLSTALPHVDTSFTSKPWWTGFGAWFVKGGDGGMGMSKSENPTVKEIVLIGGGHSHAFVIKNFGMRPIPGVRVTLISDSVETPYSGMLPGHVAGMYTRQECHIDLGRLCRFGGVRFFVTRVTKVDKDRKLIYCNDSRPPVRYDVLSIDIGSSPQMNAEDDGAQLTPVKPISKFSAKWDALLNSVEHSSKETIRIAVVGAGAGGVELALSMQQRLLKLVAGTKGHTAKLQFVLISNKDVVCPSHNALVQQKFKRILEERGVEVVFSFHVSRVSKNMLYSSDGRSVHADEIVWCTNAKTQDWIKASGFATDEGGFIRVKDTLESENTPDVFGAGDCANVVPHPRPKAGVFAVRQGPPLAENLRRAVHNLMYSKNNRKQLLPFAPQETFLGIIGTGTEYCVASRGEMALEGDWLWTLKDWIDRKWMAGYSSQLPVMLDSSDDEANDAGTNELAKLTKASHMRCGGCGAKVGKTVLDKVMENINVPTREEVELGLDAPDDCAIVRFGDSKVVQTVDFFRSFVDDPFVFGQVAANHALSDCHAMAADAVSALAIAVVPFASRTVVENDLTQMMAGACKTLEESNCALVGGHSCEGTELALGFSINGSEDSGVLTKGGVQDGDVIILTKPIGTGVIFAADMRVLARGAWVEGALKTMLTSNRWAGQQAKAFGAHSCTDVTGFGLIGHLSEMLDASAKGLVATLNINDVPLLEGALEVVRAGVFSSLQPENYRLKHALVNQPEAVRLEPYPLLFDPQTAGGLLVALPANKAEGFLSSLKTMGLDHASVIAVVNAEPETLGRIRIVSQR